jgi:four helix bundle protein
VAPSVLVIRRMAKKLEELPVYQRAVAFCAAVTALLANPALRRDRKLHEQIAEANDSITANMEEGFEQPSDASLVNYLFHSKGSLAEVLGRLRTARRKRYFADDELAPHLREGEEIGRMLGGWIRYLSASNYKDRGRFRARSATPHQRDAEK